MKLLFDQNVSRGFAGPSPTCFQTQFIWDYAAQHGFAVVTKDADSRQRSFLLGHPPKIVWLRLGNCSTKAIEALLRSRATEIEEFLADEQKAFLGLS